MDVFKYCLKWSTSVYFDTICYMANWRRRVRARRRAVIGARDLTRSQRIAQLAKLGFGGVIGLFFVTFLILPLFAFGLPSPDEVIRREGFSTKILDRNGDPLYDIFVDERRTAVPIDEIPEKLKQATVAIEDKNFYHHGGFDPLGMLRGVSRIVTRGRAQGGSTLTQQLVKNVLLSPERTKLRKLKEFILAVQVERKYTKDEILQLYLNEAPYGGTAYGVVAAAETYFDKRVDELNLAESAFIAGLPQRPSVYSPFSSTPEAYIGRTTEVLRRMREDGYITKEEEQEARDSLGEMEFEGSGASFKAPHFVQYVQKILEERYGETVVESGGLKVTTTLDLELQKEAQKVVTDEIDKVKSLKISNGAAVVVDPQTGEILAMVGSRGFDDSDIDGQVNVTTSLRQPGSAIKPFTYVAAFKEGYTASTLLMDVPTKFPGGADNPDYEPVNYDGKFRGPVQMRYALANSMNVPAVKTLAMVGIKDALQTMNDLGITSLTPTKETLDRVGLSLTLGGGEVKLIDLTSAFGAFVNEGYKVDPIAILKVEDAKGKVLEEVEPKKGKRVLGEGEAFLIADILSDNQARADIFGTNSLLNIPGREVAVKTGTTNDKRDNWTVGGNSQAVVGVWVGNNDNSPMLSVASGVTGASPIWRKIVMEALSGKPNVLFNPPSSVVSATVDAVSGYRAHDGYPSRSEYFIKGTEPGEDTIHTKLKICKSDGKLATPSDVSSGNYEEREFFVFKEEDPTAGLGGANRWQEGILNWIAEQNEPKYNPPRDYCGTSNPVNVEFVSPTDSSSDLPGSFDIKVKADSTGDIVLIELEIDGVKVRTFTGPPYTYSATLDDGIHELRAKAKDENGNESDRKITVGVNMPWNATPTPTP